jgi:transcription termination factor NusB
VASLRSKGREFAMQMLFQWDMSQQDPTKLEKKFWGGAKAAETTRAFANRLFEGAAREVSALDEMIVKHAETGGSSGWRPSIGRFCDWLSTSCGPQIRRRKSF